MRFAVLASTRGTDLQAIIDEIKAGRLKNVELACVVSNKKNCFALQRAHEQGFKTYFVDSNRPSHSEASLRAGAVPERGRPKQLLPRHGGATFKKSRVEFDREVAQILKTEKIELVVLVGYMRILTPYFVGEFKHRIINVHPALIPKYCGKDFFGNNVHEAVLKAGEKETGMTIHFVEEDVDAGPIIIQKTCPVLSNDTADTLKERVQALEKEWYPKVIQMFADGKIKI